MTRPKCTRASLRAVQIAIAIAKRVAMRNRVLTLAAVLVFSTVQLACSAGSSTETSTAPTDPSANADDGVPSQHLASANASGGSTGGHARYARRTQRRGDALRLREHRACRQRQRCEHQRRQHQRRQHQRRQHQRRQHQRRARRSERWRRPKPTATCSVTKDAPASSRAARAQLVRRVRPHELRRQRSRCASSSASTAAATAR